MPIDLLRLEQLLAVRCASAEGVQRSFLSGEHEIIDGNLELVLNYPGNVSLRVLLLETCKAMKRARPEIVDSYREKLTLLQLEKPLPGTAQEVMDQFLAGLTH